MINTGNLKLHALLGAMFALLYKARLQSHQVRELMAQDFIFQIETQENGGGYLVFKQGQVRLHYGQHAQPDFRQIWRSGDDAVKILSAGEEAAVFAAIQQGICRMEGSFAIAIRFNELMKLARHLPEPDIIKDYNPIPNPIPSLLTAAHRYYFKPTFLGLENLASKRPALYVGNHTLYGVLDIPLIMAYLQSEHGIYLRTLGDRGHFDYPVWKQVLSRSGVVMGTPDNCDRLMEAGESILVYPGGAREVWHHKDENYQLVWKNHLGFVRHAVKNGYDIIPFASLGADECYDVVVDGADFKANKWVQKLLQTTHQTGIFRQGEAVPPLLRGLGPTLIPRPQAQYFHFGPRIKTANMDDTDQTTLMAVRDQTAQSIYQQLSALRTYRDYDRDYNWSWLRRSLTA